MIREERTIRFEPPPRSRGSDDPPAAQRASEPLRRRTLHGSFPAQIHADSLLQVAGEELPLVQRGNRPAPSVED